MYFSIIWSTKCQKLNLLWLKNVNDKWCNTVINKCDCSGIKELAIHNMAFDDSTMNVKNNYNQTQVLLNKLGNKFTSIKSLSISFYKKVDDCVLLFWKSLENHILKNNSNTELQLPNKLKTIDHERLVKMVQENTPKITKIQIEIDKMEKWVKQKVWIHKIICQCSKAGLEYISIEYSSSEQIEFLSIINQLELNLDNINISGYSNYNYNLKIIQVMDWSANHKERLKDINNLLKWKMIIDRKLTLLVFVNVNMRYDKGLEIFRSEFESLCDNVLVLMEKN